MLSPQLLQAQKRKLGDEMHSSVCRRHLSKAENLVTLTVGLAFKTRLPEASKEYVGRISTFACQKSALGALQANIWRCVARQTVEWTKKIQGWGFPNKQKTAT